MLGKLQKDRIREYLESGKSLTKHEAFTILNVKKESSLKGNITQLRKEGYKICLKEGSYTMTGYTRPKVQPVGKQQRGYIEARNRLIPEAENFASKQEKLGTNKWTYVFATKMAELANEYLGCKTSWQI